MSRSPAGRPYYDQYGKALAQDFSGAAHNTINVTTEEEDLVHVKTGNASRKFTGTNLKVDYLFTKQPLGAGFGMWVHIPAGTTNTSIVIFVANDAGGFAGGNWANKTYTLIEGRENDLDGTNASPGWQWIYLKPSDFTSGTPSVAFGDIDTIRVNVVPADSVITLDGLYLNCRARAKCVVGFDDAYDDIMGADVQDYMSARNIRGTAYLNKRTIDAGVGSLTLANIEELYTVDGWDMGNHLVIHEDVALKTDAEYAAEITEVTAWLNSNGWMRASDHMAYPIGNFVRGTHDVIAEQMGMKTARSIQATLLNYHNSSPYNLYYLWSKGVNESITAANMTLKIDQAIEAGNTCMMYFHGFAAVADNATLKWAIADFQTVMDHLALKQEQGLIDSLTISQWYDGLENGTNRTAA